MASMLEGLGFFRRPPDPRPSREVEGDILDELSFHIEECSDELVAEGLTRERACAEAQRRFGDFESVRAACRRAQLGERIVLQRINLVLLVLLLVSLVFVGWGSVQAQRAARRSMEAAHVEMALVHDRLDRVAEVLEAGASLDTRSVEALRELGVRLEGPESAEDDGPPSEEELQRWVGRFHEQPESWRHGLALATEIAALSPDRALAVMSAIWAQLLIAHREQALKPFVFHGGHVHAVAILDLGATDPEPSVRARAFEYLRHYAYRDFSEDPQAYYAWAERFASEPLDFVLRQNAAEMVARLSALDGRALERELRVLARPDLGNGDVAGLDLAGVFRDCGAVEMTRRWLLEGSPETQRTALRWMGALDLDEAVQRALVLPVLQDPDAYDPGVVAEACSALGRRGNTWAVEPLVERALQILERPDASRHSDTWSIAQALAEIGDARAVPALIGMIVEDDSYETIYGLGWFGLTELTGVYYDESHDGAWWLEWWSRNRQDLPAEVRHTDVPSFHFER